MGTDKALLGPPDAPLAARVAGALRDAGAVEVLLVGGDGPALGPHGDHWLPDDHPGEGPLAAAATAARFRPGRSLVLCSCDLPFVTATEIVPLVRALDRGAPASVAEVDGHRQWSAVGLSAATAAGLGAAVDAGERALRRAVGDAVRVVAVDHPERLRDADRPAELPPDLRPGGTGGVGPG
jgi:molybdopterin-guanine dinucleotide biosynthesis protein A